MSITKSKLAYTYNNQKNSLTLDHEIHLPVKGKGSDLAHADSSPKTFSTIKNMRSQKT